MCETDFRRKMLSLAIIMIKFKIFVLNLYFIYKKFYQLQNIYLSCVLVLISFSRMAYKSHDGFRAEVRDAAGVVKVISPHCS